MASAILTKSTLESQAYENIFNLMDTRANISDPKVPSGVKSRKFIYEADPFTNAFNTDGMPYIVLELPETDQISSSTDGKHKNISFKHRITVRTARNGSSNSVTDLGKTDMLNICDDIQEMFNSMTNRAVLAGYSIYKINLTKLSVNAIDVNNQNVFEAEYELSYWTRFKTSS